MHTHHRSRILAAVLLVLAVALVAAPGLGRGRARTLTILYFNDIHGHLEPWKPDTKKEATIGGIARMAALVERIRRENRAAGRATLLLEAGDILQGTPMSAVFQGEPDMEAFNRMRIDAMAIGNHEFDFGEPNLEKLLRTARFPVLSANIYRDDNSLLTTPAVVLQPIPGMRIGVIGLTTVETPTTTFPTNVAGLHFDDPIVTARHAVPLLERECDLVVALTHIGVPEDRRLAAEVPGVDVIIGGHTQIAIPTPARVGDTVICQAQDNCRYLGRLDLTIENGRATVTRGELIPIVDGMREDRQIAAIVRGYASKLDARLSVVVGEAAVDLDGERADVRTRETTLGNFVTDLAREAAHTDVAIVNGGGLRASIGSGKVTFGDVLNTLPFSNTLVAVKLPGKTLHEALDYAASLEPEDLPGAFLQVSGLTYAIENGRATDIRIGGEPLDDAKVYSVAMPDFLLVGGDGYSMFGPAAIERVDTGIVLNGLVLDFFRKGGVANPKIEGRVVRRN